MIAQEASKTLKMAFRLCTFVGAHEVPSYNDMNVACPREVSGQKTKLNLCAECWFGSPPRKSLCISKQGSTPTPLGAGSARPNPKMGAPDPESPLFLGFSVLRVGLRPWSETMVSEGARPWGRGRSGDCQCKSDLQGALKGTNLRGLVVPVSCVCYCSGCGLFD